MSVVGKSMPSGLTEKAPLAKVLLAGNRRLATEEGERRGLAAGARFGAG
jgi:hypothetical protein